MRLWTSPPARGLLFLLSLLQAAAAGAQGQSADPDWPCSQIYASELSVAQVWKGEFPTPEGTWYTDPEIAPLVPRLASRALPLERAKAEIAALAAKVPPETRRAKLLLLFQGLFEYIDGERRRTLKRIRKYGRSQKALVERILAQSEEIERLEAEGGEDGRLALLRETRDMNLRVFDDRRRMQRYVCEQPDVLQKRIFDLALIVREQLSREEAP